MTDIPEKTRHDTRCSILDTVALLPGMTRAELALLIRRAASDYVRTGADGALAVVTQPDHLE